MNDTQLLERLTSAYATVEAPAPSAALAALLDTGGVADDERDDAVVLPFAAPVRRDPNVKLRARHLVAAMVATFVLFSGLAVAGALPDALQREVSSVVSHLGIDLPTPQPSSTGGGGDAPHDQDHPQSTTTAPGGATTVPGGSVGSPLGGTTPLGAPSPSTVPGSATTVPGGTVPAAGGTDGGPGATTTTLPTVDTLLPPLTLPPLLPPISLPPIEIPGLPPITLAPIQIPGLPTISL
jgi:hypothetical protein